MGVDETSDGLAEGGSTRANERSEGCRESMAASASRSRARIVSGFGRGRIEDVRVEERRREVEGARRGDLRRAQGQRSRIVTGFGSERVDDVIADERRRNAEGARRGDRRREEGTEARHGVQR